jgi:hypothetical protein
MLGRDEEASVQTDAYIDSLLAGHALQLSPLRDEHEVPPQLRHAIHQLEAALPRFHPSFLFEESLATRLRDAAGPRTADGQPPARGQVVLFPLGRAARPGTQPGAAHLDRRLLVGGAIASGVSLAGAAAMYAWRRTRGRREWLS